MLIQTKTAEQMQINPRKMLMFAFPKAGKTTAAAGLKNNLISEPVGLYL